jgi:hypothetical protein
MKVPSQILEKFEQAASGIDYGSATLSIFVQEGQLRYVINREESYLPKVASRPGSRDTCIQAPDKNTPQIHRYILGLTY